MATKVQIRRDSASDWTSVNPVLTAGEIGYEQDTAKMKIGDGSTAWTSLGYFAPLTPTTTVVANMTALVALTGMSSGDKAFVTANNKLFLYNGSGWYLVATVQNSSPSAITGVNSTYALATDGTAATITAVSTDPEGVPLTWSYAVTTGSLTNGGGASATVSRADNVFTITPTTNASYAGTFSITFSATDGVTGAVSAVSAFTLTFASDWSSVSQQAKLVSSDIQSGDDLGHMCSISENGSTAVVSAYGEDTGGNAVGAVYVFTRSGTTWSQQAKLQASDAASPARFGSSVDISSDGNTIAVGANNTGSSPSRAGALYIFIRSGTSWTQQAKLTASDGEANDHLGWSIGISGDSNTVVGAAPGWAVGSNDSVGALYVFTRSGTTWTQSAKLVNPSTVAYHGHSMRCEVDSDGDTIIMGCQGGYGTGTVASGTAHIFTRSGSTWSQQQQISASDAQSADLFGEAVDISNDGNTVIVGAEMEDTTGSNAGAAYVFTRSGTTWTQQAKLQASDAYNGDSFGIDVALDKDGNAAIIGSLYEDAAGSNAGAAYVFTRDGTTWSQESKITGSDIDADDYYGSSVDICGDTAIVGTPKRNSEGAAYIHIAS